eukprot:12365756-Heterocapsa_arctica.AAC.1
MQLRVGVNVCMWISLPCTAWCSWQYNNYVQSNAMRERIEEARAYSLQMVKVLLTCLRRAWRRKRESGDGTFRAAFEWPRNSLGWQQPGLAPLLRALPFEA